MTTDQPVHPRLVVSALWTAMLFVFAYVDIFGLFRADVLQAAMAGQVSVFAVSQTFLALTTLYVVIPSLMIPLTLVLPGRAAKWSNILLALAYAVTVAGSCVGETWIYYLFGSAVELVLLAAIAWRAWKTL